MDWKARITQTHVITKAFIDGAFVDAQSGKTFERINPATGQSLAHIAACDEADVDKAVSAARRSFDAGVWSALAPKARKAIMLRWSQLILEHKEELALLETLDTGKPIAETLRVDGPSCAEAIAWYAEAIDKIYDEIAPNGIDTLALVTREPLGVVAAVVPWNYPLIIAAWKLGPALAVGNSVILKPAEQSSLGALKLAELANEAGIPAGVFNVLPGLGEQVGTRLAKA
ncbi:MAG: aldehyde dehydrogenase family protein [Rhodanobacter sp.]